MRVNAPVRASISFDLASEGFPFEGAMFAILYLVQLAPTLLGITAIAGHVALVHLTARKARAVT